MSRLFIVSHRLPFSGNITKSGEIQLKPSVGGLASGLRSLINEQTIWLGWDGLTQKLNKEQKISLNQAFESKGCATVKLPARAHHAFYNDISNGVFWPLYHNQTSRIPLSLPHWTEYQLINHLFANRIAELAKPGDSVWIHDYHLQLLPKMLRDRDLGISISFFLHVPFPPPEIFRMLPIREEILEGILGADSVGFHTESYVDNFTKAARSIVSYPPVFGGLLVGGRKVEVCAAPLGVDGKRWENFARERKGGVLVESIEKMGEDNPEVRILFSVDRLDYTKGLPRKILALEKLLEKFPETRGKVTLIQIAPPSRDELPAYSRYKVQVEQMIGAINGRYGFPGYQPIHYFATPFQAEELGQCYRLVDVMLVLPLIDGMNLVAKEFVASRFDRDGVLILSEFAGAVEELASALIVNPYDIDRTADAMRAALIMPQDERQSRMTKLREDVMKFDARQWFRNFFGATKLPEIPQQSPSESDFLQPSEMVEIISNLKSPLALFIDYDGTLFPIVRRPELAAPDRSLMMLLSKLSHTPGIEVHVVSGRRFDELFQWFQRLPLHIHGDHGGISFNPTTRRRSFLKDPNADLPIMGTVQRLFERYKAFHQGVLIERKAFSTVLHYRMAEAGSMEPLLDELTHEILLLEGSEHIEILSGKKNLEVRMRGISKARVIENHQQNYGGMSRVAFGDDTTDEDMFKALRSEGVTFSVGDLASHAQYKLRDSAMVREFLRRLEAHFSQEALSFRSNSSIIAPAGVKG